MTLKDMFLRPVLAASLIALASGGAALADKARNTLNVGVKQSLPTLDAYYGGGNIREGNNVIRLLFDTLVLRDPETYEYRPLLATEWTWSSDTSIDFTIRQGVKWHDGTDLTVEDVVYTLNYVSDPENKVLTQPLVSWIEGAEALDGNVVRLHTKRPFPPALEYLSLALPIFPKAYYEEVGPEGMGQAPIGSGPYKLVSFDTSSIVVEINEDYYEGGGKPMPSIETINFKFIPDEATQIAELLGGQLDWISGVGPDQAEQLRGVPGVEVSTGEVPRVTYIGFDATGRSGTTYFEDRNMREAFARAIDVPEFVETMVGESARIISTPCFPDQFGCVQDKAVSYSFDPDMSKSLLADAGFPDGFEVDMYSFRSREWAEVVAGYLANVGIRANINHVPLSTYIQKNRAGEMPVMLSDNSFWSIMDASVPISRFFKMVPEDYARDEEISGWLDVADGSLDPEERKEYYGKAIEKITQEVYWFPMFTGIENFAFSEAFDFVPPRDNFVNFYAYGWK